MHTIYVKHHVKNLHKTRLKFTKTCSVHPTSVAHLPTSVARVHCWPRTLLSLSSGGSQSGLAKFSQAQFHPCHCTLSVTLTQGEEEDKGGVVRDLTQDEDQGDPHNASSASRSAPCLLSGCCLPHSVARRCLSVGHTEINKAVTK